MAKYMEYWDCEFCGTKKIPGSQRTCGCGAPRAEGVQFYGRTVISEAEYNRLHAGAPDWYCSYCQSGNRADENVCNNCGASKTDRSSTHEVHRYKSLAEAPNSTDEANEQDPIPFIETPETFHPDDYDILRQRKAERQSYAVDDFNLNQTQNRDLGKYTEYAKYAGIAFAGILFIFLIWRIFFATTELTANVEGFKWVQTIVQEEYQAVRETKWGSHPAEAYDIVEEWKDTGDDEKIHDGWTTETYTGTCKETVMVDSTCKETIDVPSTCYEYQSNGDGTGQDVPVSCTEQKTIEVDCQLPKSVEVSCIKEHQVELYHYEDVYDNFYTYNINRWMQVNSYTTTGLDRYPKYQEVDLANLFTGGSPQLGQQRLVEKGGTYTVYFSCDNPDVGENGTFSHTYPLNEWQAFETGTNYPFEINSLEQILSYPKP